MSKTRLLVKNLYSVGPTFFPGGVSLTHVKGKGRKLPTVDTLLKIHLNYILKDLKGKRRCREVLKWTMLRKKAKETNKNIRTGVQNLKRQNKAAVHFIESTLRA